MNQNLLIAFFISLLISFTSFKAIAQNEPMNADTTLQIKEVNKINPHKNIFKINLTALLLKNYSFQYERVLSKSISVVLGYRTMPSSTIPFQKIVLEQVGEDDETRKTIEDFRLSNSAITPELRFYVGKKGYGRGFYIAPFYRYATFETNDVNVFYTTSTNAERTIKLSGKLTTNTGGILFGVQKFIGKRIVLDTWLFGPHYGSGKGNFVGTSSTPLTQDEQNSLRTELNDIEIPLTDKTVTVNANGATVTLDGPWAGLRAGLSLGFKF